jgi:hypothetical protein
MPYELWDVEAGRGIASYRSVDEALALVRTLLDRVGVASADDLDLAVEDDGGTVVELVTGSPLAARAEAAARIANR